MVYQLVAWSESQDAAGAYVGVAAVADQITSVSGDILYVPAATPFLIGVLANIGATLPVGAYLQSPSLRGMILYDVPVCMNGLLPTTGRECVIFPQTPIPLAGLEGLEAYINSDPAAAERGSVVAFLSDGPIAPVTGAIYTVRFTSSNTLLAGGWSSSDLTLRQTLPVGTYQLVGAKAYVTNGVAFRFVGKGVAHRPGAPCVSAIQYEGLDVFRRGGMGVWLEFHSLAPPQIEVLGTTAGAQTVNGWLDLIKVP